MLHDPTDQVLSVQRRYWILVLSLVCVVLSPSLQAKYSILCQDINDSFDVLFLVYSSRPPRLWMYVQCFIKIVQDVCNPAPSQKHWLFEQSQMLHLNWPLVTQKIFYLVVIVLNHPVKGNVAALTTSKIGTSVP